MFLQQTIAVLFIALFPVLGYAQNNIASHQLGVDIPEVALLGLVSGNENDIQLNVASPAEAGSAVNTTDVENTSIWINYSSVTRSKQQSRKVVALIQGDLPPGMQLLVEASHATGNGNGKFGTPVGEVPLTSQPTEIITDIGSCYTGRGLQNGHVLTYKLDFDPAAANYADLKKSGTSINVIYTLTDNN